jgi:hypothetical protein
MVDPTTAARPDVGSISFNRQGPFYRLQRRLGLLTETDLAAPRRALLFSAFAWLPLLVLALVQGHAIDVHHERAVLLDFSVYAFAIAVVLFVLMEQASESRMASLIDQFVAQSILAETSRERFAAACERMQRRTGSWIAEAIVAIAAYALADVWLSRGAERSQAGAWFGTIVDGALQPTLAGWWALLVALPLFWFLLGRWLWRFVTWGLLLYDVARCDLRLVATHADKCGGLAFIGEYPNTYLLFVFALSNVAAATALKLVIYGGASLLSFRYGLLGLVAFVVVASVLPLMAFAPTLARLKRSALLTYGALVTRYSSVVESKWIDTEPPQAQSLGPDISLLNHLAASYATVASIRSLPVSRQTFVPLVSAAVLPFAVVAATQMPVKQVLQSVNRLLLL